MSIHQSICKIVFISKTKGNKMNKLIICTREGRAMGEATVTFKYLKGKGLLGIKKEVRQALWIS